MEEILRAVTEQQAELDSLLDGLDDAAWARASACPGWSISDVVLHLAQTNELATASARGELPSAMVRLTEGLRPADDVDDGAALMVERERGGSPAAVQARWQASCRDLREALLACDPSDRLLWVAGELSNVKLAASGHWYFCLKDEAASIDCVMYRSRAQFLDFRPENGLRVEVRARVTLYEPRGAYQLAVDELRRAGRGALHEAFEKLKARLAAEGLFEADRKRPLPEFPRAIGIVTSREAAALRDVLTVLRRRSPMTPVIL